MKGEALKCHPPQGFKFCGMGLSRFFRGMGRVVVVLCLDTWIRDVPRRPDQDAGMLVGRSYPDTWDGTPSWCPAGYLAGTSILDPPSTITSCQNSHDVKIYTQMI